MVNVDAVEILLVEDNPNDVELTLRALKRHSLANSVMVVRDGAHRQGSGLTFDISQCET